LAVEQVTQVAQSFAGEVVRLEVRGREDRLHLGVDVEGAAVGGYIERVEYSAEFAVRAFVTIGAIPVDIRRADLIDEPTNGTCPAAASSMRSVPCAHASMSGGVLCSS
jgi:hypothetical protein